MVTVAVLVVPVSPKLVLSSGPPDWFCSGPEPEGWVAFVWVWLWDALPLNEWLWDGSCDTYKVLSLLPPVSLTS